VSPQKVAEAEEVEEDALVLNIEPPNWKMSTKNLSRPLRPFPEEAVAKSLNNLLPKNSQIRSHWSSLSLKKKPQPRKVVEEDDNRLQPKRVLLRKN
jgi:hypothetical protein